MQIKKYFVCLLLFVGIASANENNLSEEKWRSFFGIEGGVGIFGADLAFFGALNPTFFSTSYQGIGYSGGIFGGWQKYTYPKVGIRHTLGFAFSYVPNIASIREGYYEDFEICIFHCQNKVLDLRGSSGQNYDFYYALDGLFDFVIEGSDRLGLSFGMSFNLIGASGQKSYYDKNAYIAGFAAMLGARLGLYAQLDRSIFELILKVPLIGVGAGDPFMTGNTLMIGYKYLI